jgi:peptidoglycan/LPS O-acetylase OafA/YrhL
VRSSSASDHFARLTDGHRVRHQPGLDGLRGLAVAAVVVFHTGLGWLPGGYLGVSLFFTLSGTVIGTVILHELGRRGAFSLSGFWQRRARRLFPAAWLLLGTVAVLRVTSTVAASTSVGDLVASWLQVANWWFLAADSSYADLFAGPSAVLHFWSLAIEEQCYVAVGVGAAVLARRSRRPAEHLAIAAGALAVASFALPHALSFSVDRTYYGTDTRAGELLVGLVLAGVIASPARRSRLLAWTRPLGAVAVAALTVTLVLWRVLAPGDDGLRTWVLPVSAVLSGGLVLGALLPGPLHVLLTWRPLRWLGTISYALYLVHWPVFLVARHADPDAGVATFAAATAAAVALAALSTRFVETPVRTGRVPRAGLAAGAVALVAAGTAVLALPARETTTQRALARIEQAAASPTAPDFGAPESSDARSGPPATPRASAPAPPTEQTTIEAAAPPSVGVYGDSVAFSIGWVMSLAADQARFELGPGEVQPGCGVALFPNPPDGRSEICEEMLDRMIALAHERDLDAVVVISCQWELLTQVLPGSSAPRSPGDPDFDAYVRDRYAHVATSLRAAGAEPLWVRCPMPSRTVGTAGLGPDLLAARDPARTEALWAIVDGLAADGLVHVLDLATWVEPRVDDSGLRFDGLHFDWDHDTGVAAEMTRLINEALTR